MGMYCKECKWFKSGYTSSNRGICEAKGTYEYPNNYCHLTSKEKQENTDMRGKKNEVRDLRKRN